MCPKDHHLSFQDLAKPFQIGPVAIRNRVVLAPMSGVTDLPFRRLAWRYGAGLVVTEMVASGELILNRGESWARLKGAGISPHMVQLAGREAQPMAQAARIAADNGADIIDINMGCPAKKVTGGYSGSALMRDPDHALSMIEATVNAVKVPVTLKMRLGWDENSINAPEIARRAEQAGIQLVTIHGRTRMQFYEGRADWDAIRAVRDAISIPLIANGDVESPEDAQAILARSGADAVMVGRGAQGRPWHVGWLAGHAAPSQAEIADLVVEHYEAMLELYGREAGLRHARKQLGWYLDRYASNLPVEEKAAIMISKDPADVSRRMIAALGGQPAAAQKEAA
ncbi:tRNA dihydrouridine synthase DusB [Neorhizobium galegae]|uniref:tRNA dihydrouridine synthase DusB n=1 Tax=Neorhizobium galegae TaxID=399 RepID=UPI00210089AA|nr:tRNA dihydrouridine synthase DusB [Neorhizobium galegae]MCQ1572500.1 tRNA dihydrouridine synthase DusB [Neorhizobium galegae]